MLGLIRRELSHNSETAANFLLAIIFSSPFAMQQSFSAKGCGVLANSSTNWANKNMRRTTSTGRRRSKSPHREQSAGQESEQGPEANGGPASLVDSGSKRPVIESVSTYYP